MEPLFAPTWWMLLLGVVLAGAVFFVGNLRLNNRLRWGSLAVLVLVGGWWGVGSLVETPTEAARDGTRRFIDSVVARDKAAMDRDLSVEVALGGLGEQDILELTPGYADEWGLKSAFITGTEIEPRGTQVIATIRVLTQHQGGRAVAETISSDWQFTWGREPDGWRIKQISPLKIGNTSITGVIERYFSQRNRR